MGVRELTVVSELLGADVPTGRDLTPEELEVLVDSIAAHPEAWSDLVAFDADDRVYVSLHRDAHVDVWLLCWTRRTTRAITTTTSRRGRSRWSPASWWRTT